MSEYAIKLFALGFVAIGLATVGAYLHVKHEDGSGWDFAAFVTWIFFLCYL